MTREPSKSEKKTKRTKIKRTKTKKETEIKTKQNEKHWIMPFKTFLLAQPLWYVCQYTIISKYGKRT